MIDVFGRKDLGTGILHNRTDGGEGVSGRIMSQETRRKISEAQKGEKNHFYGKTASEETRKKISEYHKNKYVSEETKRKIGAASKGRTKGTKWWNDGCGNHKRMVECPGDGWKPGRK